MGSSRRTTTSSASTDTAVYSLDALKRVRQSAEQRRAEQLVTQVRSLADQFLSVREEGGRTSGAEDFEKSIRARVFCRNPAARLSRIEEHLVVFRSNSQALLPRVPSPYGLKGGAARFALENLLFPGSPKQPRDIDVVRFGGAETGIWETRDREIAERLMPEDVKHGHGVEVISSIDRYLGTRDLTVNEVVVANGLVTCSRECIEDMLTGVLRPGLTYRAFPTAAITLKAARLAASSQVRGQKLTRLGFPETVAPTPFELALQLGRALEEGEEVVRAFLKILNDEQLVPRDILGGSSAASVIRHLNRQLGPGVFRRRR